MFTAMLIALAMMGITEWYSWKRTKQGSMAVDVNMPSFPEGSIAIMPPHNRCLFDTKFIATDTGHFSNQ